MLHRSSHLWAIILADGKGNRLVPLTRALYGTDLPKQFAVLIGARSMLQATVDRILPLVPPERVVVVVGRDHEALARRQLGEWNDEITLLVQPRNLDTGPGLVLPLATIRARDRTARVVVLPADHHVARPETLLTAIEEAEAVSHVNQRAVSLLGAEPDGPDTEYGWIVPGQPLGRLGMRAVLRFFEKPEPQLAEDLLRLGALWNTFIFVGAVEALWDLCRRHLAEHTDLLARCASPHELEAAYAGLPAANFSRAVLERAKHLTVIPLRGAGWTDWGTPRRVFESLAGTSAHEQLLERLTQPANARAVA